MSEKTKDQLLQEQKKEILLLKGKLENIDAAKKRSWNFKVWLIKRFAGRRLNKSLTKLYKELPNKVTKETLGDVSASIIWRITRIGIFALLATAIPYVLLYNQNKLFKAQNKLFENQNSRIDQQTKLVEAQRRSSYVLLMSNILDKVDEELKGAKDIPYHESRKLSELTIGRIAALSQSLKPYYYLDGDTLISKPLSPERGQLLLALANSKLDTIITYPKIYSKTIFHYSDLKYTNLSHANLSRANLSHANLSHANLSHANLSRANLSHADLSHADLRGNSLIKVVLDSALLFCTDLSRANLSHANLRGANLVSATLESALLYDANFDGANLRDAQVTRKEWINEIQKWNLRGRRNIENRYYVDMIPKFNNSFMYMDETSAIFVDTFYLLKPKPKK